MKLKIIKPKTRPIQIEPWFFRYLTNNEIKIVSSILAHADMRDRRSNSFPSNRTIAFYCGFDLIEKGKTLEKYNALKSESERKKFVAKKILHSINTVKATKRALVEKGILRTELIGEKGKQISYMTLDLEWKKEQYIKEHDEYFNNTTSTQTDKEDTEFILNQIDEISKLAKEGNISKENLSDRLKILSYLLKEEETDEEIPVEDVEKVADYVMNTDKIQNKIDKGEIVNKDNYKKSITKSIKKGEFNGAKDYYKGLIEKEKQEIFENLNFGLENEEKTLPYKKQILKFKDVELKNNVFISSYISEQNQIYNFIITQKQLQYYQPNIFRFTKTNADFIKDYDIAIEEFIKTHNIKKDENTLMNIPIKENSSS